MKLRRDDTVLVRRGKDRGKTGKILRVLPRAHKVVVAGVNMVKKHTKPTPKAPHGGIVSFEAPLAVANVALVCPHCGKPTRVGKQVTKDGIVRICKRPGCGAAVSSPKTK